MKFIVRLILTVLLYFLFVYSLYTRTAVHYDHEEVALYGSLLCYSCIGVE